MCCSIVMYNAISFYTWHMMCKYKPRFWKLSCLLYLKVASAVNLPTLSRANGLKEHNTLPQCNTDDRTGRRNSSFTAPIYGTVKKQRQTSISESNSVLYSESRLVKERGFFCSVPFVRRHWSFVSAKWSNQNRHFTDRKAGKWRENWRQIDVESSSA